MRFATVAFAQSTLTIWYVAIVLPILILATIVTIWGNQITGKAGKHWASEELRKLPQSEYVCWMIWCSRIRRDCIRLTMWLSQCMAFT